MVIFPKIKIPQNGVDGVTLHWVLLDKSKRMVRCDVYQDGEYHYSINNVTLPEKEFNIFLFNLN